MPQRAPWRLESLLDSSASLCLALALVILSLTGVGNVKTASLAGLILCGAGLTRGAARTDLWVLVPLTVYDLAAMASSWAAFGNIVDGYGAMHGLFPVLYLLASCLDGREQRLLRSCCLLWAGAAAAAGIGRFAFQVIVQGWAVRMSGLLGNPNAMGIFLVMSWFLLMHCDEEDRGPGLLRLEPLLLIALALTLSMGSFAAMAAGIAVLLLEKKQSASWRETVRFICPVLARAVLGMGTGLLVYLAARKRQGGASIEEVRDWTETCKLSICHQFTVDDLHFLKRGGRISGATALMGTMLNIKPVLHVDGTGRLVNIGKARGRQAALKALMDKMEQTAIDPHSQTVFISHGDCPEDAQTLAQMVRERFGVREIVINYIGPVIGAHSGPGTLALFYIGTER